jgi:hypothetical protein
MQPTYVFSDADSSFEVDGSAAPVPRGNAARLAQAALEALPTALGLHSKWMDQTFTGEIDDAPPVIVVCALDSDLGFQIASKRFGFTHQFAQSVCGPIVFLCERKVFASFFGDNAKIISEQVDKIAGGQLYVFAFVVNGSQIQLRCMSTLAPSTASQEVAT